MTPQDWSRIQQGIFAGESGGDYGALYNYQNRPNGRFSGIDVTKMTVDQALDFASPSGPYGQYVKSQVGRVATPMGAYQVVGSTLRDAKRAMGLKGDEVLTPQLQDQIGQWIYKTQGTGAWEGYKGAAANNTETKPMMQEQQPRGLLGSLGIQKRDEAAGGETAQPFYQRDTFKDTAATLAQGFAAMGSMPALQKMTADIAQQRTENKARNKTAEYLRKNNRADLADMVEKGLIGGREAESELLRKPEDTRTAMMKNYEFFVSQGMSPEQARNAVQSGNIIDINTGDRGPKVGTIPQGYQLITDPETGASRLEPIPGGPADQSKTSGAKKAAEAQSGATVLSDIEEMQEIIRQSPNLTTGVGAQLLRGIGGTKAGDLDKLSETVRSNIGFDRLQRMREESPTGGALGQVAVQELTALQASLGSLSTEQSPAQLLRNLERLEEQYRKSMKRILETEGGAQYFTQSEIDMINSSNANGQASKTKTGVTFKVID